MKENKQIKPLLTRLSLLGLIMLLLLSPCKVRNSIEFALGIPQTKVSNRNIATVSNNSCSVYEVRNAKVSVSQPTKPKPPLLTVTISSNDGKIIGVFNPTFTRNERWEESASPVPYYLLYQNFKVYL